MSPVWERATETGTVRVVVSDRRHGDFHLTNVAPDELERRRRALVDAPWTMLDEVHGTEVVRVARPGDHDRVTGDVVVTDVAGAVLGVWVGDCAPVVVVTPHGRVAAAHAGWRGIAAGVLDVLVDSVTEGASTAVPGTTAYLGPCIGPCCYEFGDDDLRRVADAVGVPVACVRGTTASGAAAADVAAAVRFGLARRGVTLESLDACTGCDPRWYSHRVRGESGRQVVAVWKTGTAAA